MHPRKRFRPVAAGDLAIPSALAASLALFSAGLLLSGYTRVLVVPFLILLYSVACTAQAHPRRFRVVAIRQLIGSPS
jgi:4-hydroxybenzoate polyprenyltransferase